MSEIAAALLFIFVAVLSERVWLKRVKSQTCLSRMLAIFGLAGAVNLALISMLGGSVLVVAVFWASAFGAWFVVRSHLESSIFLQMLNLLRGGRLTAEELLAKYESVYGAEERVLELRQAGLIEGPEDSPRVTRKGWIVLRVRRWVRGCGWGSALVSLCVCVFV